jgi:hypothetical protein
MDVSLTQLIQTESYAGLEEKINRFLNGGESASNRLKMYLILLYIAKQCVEKAGLIEKTGFIQPLLQELADLKENKQDQYKDFILHLGENEQLNGIINKGNPNGWIQDLENKIKEELKQFDAALKSAEEVNARLPFVEALDKQ